MSKQDKNPLSDRIARQLYELDPMNIGTVENEMFDEYMREARQIVEMLV